MSAISVQDRCGGVLLGLAAGDRNGGPIRMAVRLAESLLELGRFDPQEIVGRYLRWWREGAFDTGPVSERALELMAAGMSALEASAQVHQEFAGKTAGCNPAHGSSPLAMLASLPDEDLPGCAMTEARLTDHNPLAGDVAAAVTVLCRSLIHGIAWDIAVQRSAEERQAETSAALFSVREGPGTSGGFAPEVVRAAVYFVGSSSSFSEALERSVVFAGPANYCPLLVGATAVPGGVVQQYLLQPWPMLKSSPGWNPAHTDWLRGGSWFSRTTANKVRREIEVTV